MVADPTRPVGVSRRSVLATAGTSGLAALAGCTVGASQDGGLSGEVAIAGSSTVYPISWAVAEAFFEAHPGVAVTVSSTGTGAGFSNFFCPGMTDINDASRPIAGEERRLCAENGVTPVEFQIATDAVTVVVNPENEWVECLDFAELREIWGPTDPAQRWSDVHAEWPNEPMNLLGPSSASGTFDFFTETVMGEEGAHRADYQQTELDNVIVTAVTRSPFALGYLGFAYYVENQDELRGVPITEGDGPCVEPTFETAKTGAYPLSRPLFVYVAKESLAEPAVREFVDFYVRKSGTELIKRVGYVPVDEGTVKSNLAKLRRATEEVTT